MMTKKITLLLGFAGAMLTAILFLAGSNYCFLNPLCNDTFLIIFLIPFPIFIFSLLTYRMNDQVFHAWFNFAKWWVPVIIGVTLFFEYMGGGGGGWGMSGGAFDAFFVGIFYFIFIVVSLVKIVQMYIKTRGKKN